MEYTDQKVKGQLEQSAPNTHQLLFNMYFHIAYDLANSRMSNFDDCIKFMVDCEIAVTPDYLKSAVNLSEAFIMKHFICHLKRPIMVKLIAY